jgi:WhiB family transcriptional regulator, redox-sensing transcriptional regulator
VRRTLPIVSWEDHARCSKHDPDIFFVPRVAFERRAKTICSRCPVRVECLAFAVEARIDFGIWGGLNEKERRGERLPSSNALPSREQAPVPV